MKVRIFIISIWMFSSANIFAQDPTISLQLNNSTLEKLLEEIKTQTAFDYVLSDDVISPLTKVSINVKDVKLSEALNELSGRMNITFKITEKTILIIPKIVDGNKKDNNSFGVIRQNIRGIIIDKETKMPLTGSNIILVTVKPFVGVTSDDKGTFVLKNIPVGRHSIQVSFMGYKSTVVSELLLTSAKELYLEIELEQSIEELEEVIIKPSIRKDKPLNSMASISARSFTVEESQRYAGGIGDPTRMASSYAGVSAGYDLDGNGISVRGHRPGAIVWRLEDVEIPNPNHFAGAYTAGAGFVCLVSNQLMANSDFYTGAFPAEIGNSLSAAFDLKLRPGNAYDRGYTFQAGVLGIDIATEGPFVKGKRATYNINYRYSTLGLLGDLHIIPKGFLPRYQDLTYKFNFPTKKAGTFTFWGTGGVDYSSDEAEKDSSLWNYDSQQFGEEIFINMGATGLSHKYNIKNKTYVKTSLVGSIVTGSANTYHIDSSLTNNKVGSIESNTKTLTLSTFINYTFGSNITSRSGFNIHNLYYDIDLNSTVNNNPSTWYNYTKANNSSYLMQFYTQSRFKMNKRFSMNVGLHAQVFMLNNNYTIEPRIGMNWEVSKDHMLSLGYGKHSQLEELRYYFIKDKVTGEYLNKELDFAKAHHFILGYDWHINDFTRLKVEPYYQYLYNYPGIRDSSFSLINLEQDWELDAHLENVSKGVNYGIDITVERFLQSNYYFLLTGSLFNSKYTGGDGITRNTRFNKAYTANFLLGKEYFIGTSKNNVFSANVRINYFGGNRTTPVDWDKTVIAKEIIRDNNRLFEDKQPYRCYIDISIRYIKNKPNVTATWSFDALNVIPALSKKITYSYNHRTDLYKTFDDNNIVVPFLSYKVEF